LPENSIATDLNAGSAYGSGNLDMTGLAVTGDATSASMIAGAADSAQTYFSSDGGISSVIAFNTPTCHNPPSASTVGTCSTAPGATSNFSTTPVPHITWLDAIPDRRPAAGHYTDVSHHSGAGDSNKTHIN